MIRITSHNLLRFFVALCLLLPTVIGRGQGSATYLIGRTTGPFPYLEYGLGDDRLGGAKMTYLDSGVLMRVTDSVRDDYRVRLSATRYGYLPKASFLADSTTQLRPYYLSGHCRIWGDSLYDYVSLFTEERLPYTSRQMKDPSRIVVDVFGLTSNTNWINHLQTAREIREVWYEQVEDDVFRVYIQLRHKQHWGHSIRYDSLGRTLIIRVKRQPPLSPRKLLIAIDAGHGGDNPGAKGKTSGILEKDYTLKIAQQLDVLLRKSKVPTFMTRNNDTSLSIIERLQMLQTARPDLLLSIHLNSSGNDTIRGTSTFYRYPGFRSLSQSLLKRMLELNLKEFGNVGSFNFGLNGATDYPNCLIEVAFLSNEADEKRILDPAFHKAVARKIYLGLMDWLNALK